MIWFGCFSTHVAGKCLVLTFICQCATGFALTPAPPPSKFRFQPNDLSEVNAACCILQSSAFDNRIVKKAPHPSLGPEASNTQEESDTPNTDTSRLLSFSGKNVNNPPILTPPLVNG
jgi:hypothetical protein